MDEQTITTPIKKKVQDALSGIPEEVQSFMWSDDYDVIIRAIQKTVSLSEDQLELVRTGSYELLLRVQTMESLYTKWITAGIDKDLAIKILYLIDQEILSRARTISEFFSPDETSSDDSTQETTATANAPSPADVLATLGARLNQTTIAPRTTPSAAAATPLSKRDYSLDTTLNADPRETVPEAPRGIASIDPYREIPEK